jgi:hypothetical protein
MTSSETWRRVSLVRTDVSQERIASIIGVKRISELGKGAMCSSERSVLTRATRRHISEDDIFHSQLRENLKPYKVHILYLLSFIKLCREPI